MSAMNFFAAKSNQWLRASSELRAWQLERTTVQSLPAESPGSEAPHRGDTASLEAKGSCDAGNPTLEARVLGGTNQPATLPMHDGHSFFLTDPL